MKYIIVAILLLFVSANAMADPAYKVSGSFMQVIDADNNPWVCDDTTYTIVYNDGDPAYLAIAGRCWLPEGATLPEAAFSYDAADTDYWCGCLSCSDESHYVVTPTGRVNFHCRMQSD